MKLSETWFIEGYVDFELQKYKLLAYLQEVNKYFTQAKLYPQLADMVFHYNNLISLRDNKQFLQNSFPKQLTQIDLQKLELTYEAMLEDSELMQELERIIQYATPQLKRYIEDGAEIYDAIERQLRVEPVGIMPIYKDEGYVLLQHGAHDEVLAYAYAITLFEEQDARYKGIRMEYIDTFNKSIVNTYEQMKLDIIRSIRTLPNPAVFCVVSPLAVPLNETLLPITKRLVAKQLAA
jgi:hypothetical protein